MQKLSIFDCKCLRVMLVIFLGKIKLRNINKAWFIVLFSFLILNISAQNKAATAEKKKEQIKIKQQKVTETKQDAGIQHQFKIQTKKVQKRMKENEKNTNKYYNKKLGNSFFYKLFGKKRRK